MVKCMKLTKLTMFFFFFFFLFLPTFSAAIAADAALAADATEPADAVAAASAVEFKSSRISLQLTAALPTKFKRQPSGGDLSKHFAKLECLLL